MIPDCFEHAFAKQWIPRSSTYVQAWTLFLSLRVSCPNEAFSMVSFFLFRGKSWAQVFPQLGRRREKPRRPSFTNWGVCSSQKFAPLATSRDRFGSMYKSLLISWQPMWRHPTASTGYLSQDMHQEDAVSSVSVAKGTRTTLESLQHSRRLATAYPLRSSNAQKDRNLWKFRTQPGLPSGTRSVMQIIVFQKSSVEWQRQTIDGSLR